MWDAFCRAVIRFFDNRFVQNWTDADEVEIERLHKIIDKLLNERAPKTVIAEFAEPEMQVAMKPIETIMQKRARLERESRAEWDKQMSSALQEMNSKLSAGKETTEELEKSVGVNS